MRVCLVRKINKGRSDGGSIGWNSLICWWSNKILVHLFFVNLLYRISVWPKHLRWVMTGWGSKSWLEFPYLSPLPWWNDVSSMNIYLLEETAHFFCRTVGKASSEMRLYFCAPKSCLGDLSSGLLDSTESVYPKGSLNKRGSYLSGQLVYGDAILASIGYKWKSSDLVYEDVSLRTYYRFCALEVVCTSYT